MGPQFASFDTETTGVDTTTDRIITAALYITPLDTGPERHEWLINPGIDIPEAATAIHGITTQRAQAEGQEPRVALDTIRTRIYTTWALGLPLVVFNAPYDLTLLDRELIRHQLGRFEIRGPVIDPLLLDRYYDKWRKGSRKLIDAAAHYRVRTEDAHNAMGDAIMSARIAYKIRATKMSTVRDEDLNALQSGAYKTWAADFSRWLVSKGEPAKCGCWPLCVCGL